MKTQLLIERLTANESNLITESAQNGKDLFLKGIFMQADIKNRNGRIYPINEMVNATEYLNKSIKETGGVFGELDHPENLVINMKNISHVITELRMDGSNVIGTAKILGTPMGLIAKECINSGVRPAVSSRGAGNVNESGLVEGFSLITVDIVATPSAMGATPNAVYEGLMNSKQGYKVYSLAEQLQEDVSAQKFFSKELLSYIRSITKK